MDEQQCQIEPYLGYGQNGTCDQPPAWVYINGDFRRLECDHHARITRANIRYPGIIRLEPLKPPP